MYLDTLPEFLLKQFDFTNSPIKILVLYLGVDIAEVEEDVLVVEQSELAHYFLLLLIIILFPRKLIKHIETFHVQILILFINSQQLSFVASKTKVVKKHNFEHFELCKTCFGTNFIF